MSFEHKPDTGSLFVNDKREKDTHPNAKGSALIDGVDYWVSAWTNTTKGGAKYQSLKFSRKDENRQPRAETLPDVEPPFNDEIPFALLLPAILGGLVMAQQVGTVIA